MLLKSSSTPVLGSLLSSSISDSPNNSNHIYYHDTNYIKHHPKTIIPLYQTGNLNIYSSLSCNSSPISPSIASKAIRRAQSEGNLEGLAYGSCFKNEDLHDSSQLTPKKITGRSPNRLVLQTIPSFSFYGSRDMSEDDEEEEKDEEFDLLDDVDEEREQQEKINHEISNRQTMVLTQERVVSRYQEMFHETGVGLGGDNSNGGGSSGGNGGRGGKFNSGGGDGRNKDGAEEYYRRMVEENPGNPLFLRNYAEFLYQVKSKSSNQNANPV